MNLKEKMVNRLKQIKNINQQSKEAKMNLKQKLKQDYPALKEHQIEKIIKEAEQKVEEEKVREIVRDELNILDEEVPF